MRPLEPLHTSCWSAWSCASKRSFCVCKRFISLSPLFFLLLFHPMSSEVLSKPGTSSSGADSIKGRLVPPCVWTAHLVPITDSNTTASKSPLSFLFLKTSWSWWLNFFVLFGNLNYLIKIVIYFDPNLLCYLWVWISNTDCGGVPLELVRTEDMERKCYSRKTW